jgi:GT2 family glycosyltransferase
MTVPAAAATESPEPLPCAVVIPVHNHAGLTRTCLEAVLALASLPRELVVVDDGSTDATPELLERFSDRARVVRHEQRRGFAAACNAGAAATEAPFLLFLNNDTVPTAGWLEALLAAAEAGRTGVVGAKLLFPDSTVQCAGIAFDDDGRPFQPYIGFPADHPAVDAPRRMQAVTGACMLVRREAFEAVGGFDLAWVNGYEDVDLCLRIAQAGWETRYEPRATVYHLESATRGRAATVETDANRELYRQRWASKVDRDHVDLYLGDGLLRFDYGHRWWQPRLEVDPLLASLERPEADTRIEEVVSLRTRHVRELSQENAGLLARAAEDPATALGVRDDRWLGLQTGPAAPSAPSTSIERLRAQLAPLELEISATEPVRVNLLAGRPSAAGPGWSPDAVALLASRLAQRGHRARIVRLEAVGDAGSVESVESVALARGEAALPVSPSDRFVASSWWTARLAHAAAAEVSGGPFAFLITDDEARLLPAGSAGALAEQSYRLPFVPLFSSEPVRDHFAARGLGPAANGAGPHLTFRPPIAMASPSDRGAAHLAARGRRRLICAAHPGADQAGSGGMLELLVLALRQAVRDGTLDASWHVTAITAQARPGSALDLGAAVSLDVAARLGRPGYEDALRTSDMAIALADSPHPSLTAIEMAAHGLPTVTCAAAGPSREQVEAVSPNLVCVAPAVAELADALRRARERSEDAGACLAGSAIDWSRTPEEALPDALLEALALRVGIEPGS